KSDTDRNRVAGVTGLNCRMPMSALEHLDRVALLEGHDRLLPRRPAAHVAAIALPLGAHRQRPHVRYGHLEQRLDGRADLRLGGLCLHAERVLLAGLKRRRGFLGDHRPDDQMVLLRHPRPPPSRSRRPPPAPAARRPGHPPTGSRTRWRRRTASRAPSAGCVPTGRRCARAPRPPLPPGLSFPPRPAWRAAPPTSWSSASRTRARPPRTARRAGARPSFSCRSLSNAAPQSWRLRPPCLRTVTSPLNGPGTEPRTNSRLRSASTLTTRRPSSVKRRAPMWPGIRLPLMMRDGSVPGAIDPGLRCRVLPWVSGPPPK